MKKLTVLLSVVLSFTGISFGAATDIGDGVTISTASDVGTIISLSTDQYHSFRVLTWEDYDRLKELQYINAFKGILETSSMTYEVASKDIPKGIRRYQVIQQRIILAILHNDPLDFFSDCPACRDDLMDQFVVNIST